MYLVNNFYLFMDEYELFKLSKVEGLCVFYDITYIVSHRMQYVCVFFIDNSSGIYEREM